MVKPIIQVYPVIPAADEAEREALRPLGRNVERYNDVLHGWTDIVRAADEQGFWGAATIEHHFHSEGYEVGPNPGLLNAYWAALTERVRIGQLGYTMGAQNPVRVAEDTAILDHLTRGRCFVGFSRGYQARWTNILGQHVGSRATLSPTGATAERLREMGDLQTAISDDQINRAVFEEQIEMVLDAWKSESVVHNSSRWQIPFPYDEGVAWDMSATRHLGAPGEMDDSGHIRRVSVVPAPYSAPHPPVFVASSASQETIEYCGAKDFIPTYFSGIGRAGKFGRAFVEHAAAAGRHYALGEHQAMVRWIQIGDTTEEAHAAIRDYDLEIYRNLYKALTPVMPYDEANPVQSVLDCGLWAAGTVDEVRDQLVAQWQELPAEYIVLIFHYAQMPKEKVIDTMARFMRDVKPALDELTDYAPAAGVTSSGPVHARAGKAGEPA